MTDEFPKNLEAAMIRTNTNALSWQQRARYLALLLGSIAVGIVLIALLATEPDLPAHTFAAFSGMALMAAGWVALATWVLTRRRPLYSRDRVVAGRMAVSFSGLFTAGASVVAVVGGGGAAVLAGGLGLLMTLAAIWLLVKARHRVRDLEAQRHELARQIVGGAA